MLGLIWALLLQCVTRLQKAKCETKSESRKRSKAVSSSKRLACILSFELCISRGQLLTEMYDGLPEAELPSFPKLELEDLHMVLCLTNQLLSTNLRIMTHLGQIVVQKMMGKTHQGKIERFRR